MSDPDSEFFQRWMTLWKKIDAVFNAELHRAGISYSEYLLLESLQAAPQGMEPSALADARELSRQHVNLLLRQLEAAAKQATQAAADDHQHAGHDALGVRITKQPQDAHGLPADLIDGAKQRSLLIQGRAGVAEEAGGDKEAAVLHKGKSRGIPGSIAACLKGSAETARGKTGCVRLAANKLFARKTHNDAAVGQRVDE